MERKRALMMVTIVLMLLSLSSISNAQKREALDKGFVKLFNGKTLMAGTLN